MNINNRQDAINALLASAMHLNDFKLAHLALAEGASEEEAKAYTKELSDAIANGNIFTTQRDSSQEAINKLFFDALYLRDYYLAELALRNGAEVSAKGNAALQWAVASGDQHQVLFLVKNGARMDFGVDSFVYPTQNQQFLVTLVNNAGLKLSNDDVDLLTARVSKYSNELIQWLNSYKTV